MGAGTGLGLASVHGAITQSGGHIQVDSEPGRGTSFKVFLPATQRGGPRSRPTARRPTTGSAATRRSCVCEDEDGVRALVELVLAGAGYRVLSEGRPSAALARAAGEPGHIHGLVTDVIMPDMPGPELARQLGGTRPGLRTLFISGYTADTVRERGSLPPGSAFLEKPFDRATLLRTLRELLAYVNSGVSVERAHLVVGRPGAVALGGVEQLRQHVDVARREQERLRVAEHPAHGAVDVGLLGQRLVPGRGGVLAALPRLAGEALDRLQRDVALLADGRELVVGLGVARVLHLHVVVRAQHGVEGEAPEAAQVHPRDAQAVAGDADEAHQPLVARLDAGLQRAAGAERDVPLDHVAQVVELDRVDVVDAEPVQRAADLLARGGVRALAGLGGDEEVVVS